MISNDAFDKHLNITKYFLDVLTYLDLIRGWEKVYSNVNDNTVKVSFHLAPKEKL